MKNLALFLILVIISNNILADTVNLKKGDPAPFPGVLMDSETSNKIKGELEEKDYLGNKVDTYTKIIKLQDLVIEKREKQMESINEQNDILHKRLQKIESTSSYERALWFGLGVLGTGISVYGAQKLLR